MATDATKHWEQWVPPFVPLPTVPIPDPDPEWDVTASTSSLSPSRPTPIDAFRLNELMKSHALAANPLVARGPLTQPQPVQPAHPPVPNQTCVMEDVTNDSEKTEGKEKEEQQLVADGNADEQSRNNTALVPRQKSEQLSSASTPAAVPTMERLDTVNTFDTTPSHQQNDTRKDSRVSWGEDEVAAISGTPSQRKLLMTRNGSSVYLRGNRRSSGGSADDVHADRQPCSAFCAENVRYSLAYCGHLCLFGLRFGAIMCLTVLVMYLIPFTPADNPDFSCDNPDYFNFPLTMSYSCIAVGTIGLLTITAAAVALFPEAWQEANRKWFIGTLVFSLLFMWVTYIVMAILLGKKLYFYQGQQVGAATMTIDAILYAVILRKSVGRWYLFPVIFFITVVIISAYGVIIIPEYLKADQPTVKALIRLIGVPLVDKIMIVINRLILKQYRPARELDRAYAWVFLWTVYSTFFGRFMVTASDSWQLTVVMVSFGALMDILLIVTVKAQLKWLPSFLQPVVDDWVLLTNYTLALELTHAITTNVVFYLLARHHLLLDFGYSSLIVEEGGTYSYSPPTVEGMALNSVAQFATELLVVLVVGFLAQSFLQLDLLQAWRDRHSMLTVEIPLAVLVVVLSMNMYLIVPLNSTCPTLDNMCECGFDFHKCSSSDAICG